MDNCNSIKKVAKAACTKTQKTLRYRSSFQYENFWPFSYIFKLISEGEGGSINLKICCTYFSSALQHL